jgi:hypothetical protein
MSSLTSAWLSVRLRKRIAHHRVDGLKARGDLLRRYAPGNSFVDVGCMWNIHGRDVFMAEECGATKITGVDGMEPTPEFRAEHDRRSSKVRFVRGDLHDPPTLESAGPHDVVWSFGVIYHSIHPLLTLERLAHITRKHLVLGTAAIPEVPGLPNACVFYPGLSEAQRNPYLAVMPGATRHAITDEFDPDYFDGNWYWGITPSALRGMLAAARMELVEEVIEPFHAIVVARPRG